MTPREKLAKLLDAYTQDAATVPDEELGSLICDMVFDLGRIDKLYQDGHEKEDWSEAAKRPILAQSCGKRKEEPCLRQSSPRPCATHGEIGS